MIDNISMKTRIYLLLALLLTTFFSCRENEGNIPCAINIRLEAPEGYAPLPYGEIKVVLTNKDRGTAYTSLCSASGIAKFRVEQGFYTATVHYQTASGLIFSGRLESLTLLSDKNDETVSLPLTRSQTNALVIKEIYYGGCIGRKGEEYQSDQYITLYNNSEKVLYLDGLCIAVVDPASGTESAWMKYTDMARIPVNDLAWQFPGDGTQYPLQPGEETTIATNAVDHTGGEYQHANSIDLSKADWAFWDSGLSSQDITPGVKPLTLFSNLNPNLWMYSFPVAGPTIMVFSIEGTTAEAYAANPDNRENKPEYPNKAKFYLMIPKEWVIDCVECVENADHLSYKRVPNELNSNAIYISGGSYSGESVIRKSSTNENGFTVFRDTNNSADDMEVSVPSLKNK